MNESTTTPAGETPAEETTTPEEETAEETTEETEESTEEAETAEAETPKTFAGVKPLESVSDVFTFAESGGGEWHGDTDEESLAAVSADATKAAKTIVRATTTLSNAYRALATALLIFRSGVWTERPDGTVGPDWAGKSRLSERYTALTVYKPLSESGYDSAKIRGVMNQVSVYMGRKVPGTDYTLRDKFIADWAAQQQADAGREAPSPAESAARVDAESASTGLKSAAMSAAERGTGGGPGTTTPESPLPALKNSVRAIQESKAEVSDAELLTEAWKLLTQVAVNVYMSDGHWTDSAEAKTALAGVALLVDALVEDADGKREAWTNLLSAMYGSKTAETAHAAKTEARKTETAEETTPAEAEEAESTETETAEEETPEAATA